MLKDIYVITTKNTYPYRNLAMEEYLTHNIRDGECVLFLWQNEPSVIVGKNQDIYSECDTEAIIRDGVHPVRRLSGGGAVYHDKGNLNFTFCVKNRDYDTEKQSDVILRAVNSTGVKAVRTGRNDLTVDGKKFSGHAFYKNGDNRYHHGTLLLNSDFSKMQKYLTPDSSKLASKGVRSVKARVMNLSEQVPEINTEILSDRLIQSFSELYGLPVKQMNEKSLPGCGLLPAEKKFASDEFIYGKKVTFTHRIKKRFPWGGLELLLNVTDGIITEIKVLSDCMDADLPGVLEKSLIGHRYDEENVMSLLNGQEPSVICSE